MATPPAPFRPAALLFLACVAALSAPAGGAVGEIEVREFAVMRPVSSGGRSPVHSDAIEALIVAGRWQPPRSGDSLDLPGGVTASWQAARTGDDGWLSHPSLRGGYASARVSVPLEAVMVLEASGDNLAYVNGEPRVGDPYSTGYVRLPVLLKAGENELLFQCSRGRLHARLTPPPASAFLNTDEATLPDLRLGEKVRTQGAVVVVNATRSSLDRLSLRASLQGGRPALTDLPSIPALSIRKVAFRIEAAGPTAAGTRKLDLTLLRREKGRRETLDTRSVELRVRRPDQTYKRTFVSDLDGSLQYYAVNPAREAAPGSPPPALFLTLHGAGVEAIGQADAYSPKSWGHLVAPTNRRPYGFDWEDWGRMDALEVLERAKRDLHTDPARTYLTGHSMGGHGTWQIGATFPDLFAAIGPSAGWISFANYAGGVPRVSNGTPLQQMLDRPAQPSDTLALARNYAHHGVYILHGAADDNVPVEQARQMNRVLAAFHHDFTFFEQPGAGHWWDVSDEPGADCVDWAPMFDFFARRTIPPAEGIRRVEFATANPGISSRSGWATIEAQVRPLQLSTIDLRCDPTLRRCAGTTYNVARLALDTSHLRGDSMDIEFDGQKLSQVPLPTGGGASIHLERHGDIWSVMRAQPSPGEKNPARCGPFKEAFRHRMLFVYGTAGTAAENAWAFAKARYDAETWWYRANGAVDVVADSAFDPTVERERAVILYGNEDTNRAWKPLLADCQVHVRRGQITVGARALSGGDLACLFAYPRPGSDHAMVAAVAGSGLPGMRLTDRLPYFVSGVHYPDLIILGPETLAAGRAGVRAAGFFGLDWSVEKGEWAWRD